MVLDSFRALPSSLGGNEQDYIDFCNEHGQQPTSPTAPTMASPDTTSSGRVTLHENEALQRMTLMSGLQVVLL
jgi:hypothetical protein